jgi:hypothetical protein
VYQVYVDVGVKFILMSQIWIIVKKIDNDTCKVKSLGFDNVEQRVSREVLLELEERGLLKFLSKVQAKK